MHALALVAVSVLAWSCAAQESPPNSANEVVIPGAAILIGAGDIAICGSQGDEATARLVDSLLIVDSAANVENAVITMGDNAYPSGREGSRGVFTRCFAPSWGTKRIMDVIHPAPGNHDFETTAGLGYYDYFGSKAGPPRKGYYSYDIGTWHIVSLNSEVIVGRAFIAEAKLQEDWLRDDLKAHAKQCTLAYWHRPLFSSGWHGSTREARGLWNILYDNDVDVIVTGHEHHYERFLPQTPAGIADSVRGIAEFIAGTGGADLRALRHPLAYNSAFQLTGYFGVVKLTLGDGEYRHAFIDTTGRVWDEGSGKCH